MSGIVLFLLCSLFFTLLNVILLYFLNKDFKKKKQEVEKLFKNEFVISYTLLIIQSLFYIFSFSFFDTMIFYVLIGLNVLFNITILSFIFEIRGNQNKS